MGVNVTVAGDKASLLSELMSEDLILPMSLAVSAIGISSFWDETEKTLHLASPVYGKRIALAAHGPVSEGAGFSGQILEDLKARLTGAGALVTDLMTDHGNPGWSRQDIRVVILEPSSDSETPSTAAAYWGWAAPLTSWLWARRLMSSYRGYLGLSRGHVKSYLSWWQRDYAHYMSWGNAPTVAVQPVSFERSKGKELLSEGLFVHRCARALFEAIQDVFRSSLSAPDLSDPEGRSAPVDYASLQRFWAWSSSEETEEASEPIHKQELVEEQEDIENAPEVKIPEERPPEAGILSSDQEPFSDEPRTPDSTAGKPLVREIRGSQARVSSLVLSVREDRAEPPDLPPYRRFPLAFRNRSSQER